MHPTLARRQRLLELCDRFEERYTMLDAYNQDSVFETTEHYWYCVASHASSGDSMALREMRGCPVPSVLEWYSLLMDLSL